MVFHVAGPLIHLLLIVAVISLFLYFVRGHHQQQTQKLQQRQEQQIQKMQSRQVPRPQGSSAARPKP
jgi:uncharacterized protein HemX